MDKAARNFAMWVLGIHLMVLAILVVIVIYASTQVYTSARRQALNQVRIRQELLAGQAARGIQGFYRSILDYLAMAQQAELSKQDITPLLWEPLRGQATHLVLMDPRTRAIVEVKSDDQTKSDGPATLPDALAQQITQALIPADEAGITVAGQNVLASVPTTDRLLVAVIPIRSIESRYLNDLNQPVNISSLLTDESMRVLSDEDHKLAGTQLDAAGIDPRIREVAEQSVRLGQRDTREFLDRMTLGEVELVPAMVTIQPVDLPGGKKWWLAVSSSLSEVDAAVGQFFKRALIGAGLVILAMTGIIVSTSVQMIRGRLRLERLQTQIMRRELEQAREIQLMWLPERQGVTVPLDVAAVNQPTSHISGDFYNWFELPDGRVCVVVGDVTGHGLPAAFLMATTQLLVRTTIERLGDPGAALRETNRQLCTHVFSGQFVTLLVMVIDASRNRVELAMGGHPPPLVGTDADYTPLPVEPQLVLAIEPDVPYKTQRFDLPQGATLLLYTDGVTDVQAPAGARLGADGLQRSLQGRFDSARTMVDTVLDSIESFRAGRELSDDLTLLSVRLAPEPAPADPGAAADALLLARP